MNIPLPKQNNEPLYEIFEKKYESDLPEISTPRPSNKEYERV